MKVTPEVIEFFNYCYDWYGKGGFRDHGATREMIAHGVMWHLNDPDREIEFQGDSLDREHVREYIIWRFGLEEVESDR